MKKILLISLLVILTVVLASAVYYFVFYQKDSPEPASTPLATSQTSSEQPEQDDCQLSSRGQNTPYYHQVYSATSTDGLNWTKNGQLLFDHASVPGAVIKDGVIYLYFVDASAESDQLSVAISDDLGKTFEKHKVTNKEMASCDMVDPHPELIGLSTDSGQTGRIRLYYLGNFTKAPELEQKGEMAFEIYSAESEDGINFSQQNLAYAAKSATTDPDVFRTDKDWRMLVSKGKELVLAISTDRGKTFNQESGFSWDKGGVTDTFNFNGTFRTFYCGQGIESATGVDQGKLTSESGKRLEEKDKITCDPSIIQLPDGSYLMFYKVQEMPQSPTAPSNPGSAVPESNSPNN